ncbi:MAG TPA: hypothetical protein VIJ14_02120 [Rhabdochlamydiaceae bacterium]
MAKSSKKRSKVRQKDRQKKAKIGKNDKEIAYLEKLILYSARCTQTQWDGLNLIFLAQIEKLCGQIEKLKENQ